MLRDVLVRVHSAYCFCKYSITSEKKCQILTISACIPMGFAVWYEY